MKDLDIKLYEILMNILNDSNIITYCQIVTQEEANFSFQLKSEEYSELIPNVIYNNTYGQLIKRFNIALDVVHTNFFMLTIEYQQYTKTNQYNSDVEPDVYRIVLTKAKFYLMYNKIYQVNINMINRKNVATFKNVSTYLDRYLDSEQIVSDISTI